MKRISYLAYAILSMLFLLMNTSCKEEPVDYTQQEIELIEEFMTQKQLDIEPTESGLYFMDEELGTGDYPVVNDTVEVYYSGYFLNGLKFDSNTSGDPFEFVVGVSGVINGWHEGLQLIREGGKAALIIPSWLGYGSSGYASIPGYASLYFKIELLEIKPGADHIK